MRQTFFLLILALPFATQAQTRFSATVSAGFTNYYGDLQNKPVTLDQSKGAFGVGLKYDLTDHIAVRSGLLVGTIGATDAKNKLALQFRNLSFQSRITEFSVAGEYTLFSMNERKLSPYVFGGIALFHFNPYAFDTLGNKHYLKPLSTEGQGLSQYPDRKPYRLTQFALPFGAGVKFRVTDNVVLSYEFGLRKTFTDYLDDVSKTYVSQAALLAAKGQTAVDMSYRADELKNGDPNYPDEFTVRGGSSYKDWYYFSGFTLTIGINQPRSLSGSRGRGGLDCPRNF